jgi:hypothetical protein
MSICPAAVELIAKLILNPADYLSPGCRTRSHRPLARFRFGDGSQQMMAKWDDHTMALGHRLLADKLYEGLVPLLSGSSNK